MKYRGLKLLLSGLLACSSLALPLNSKANSIDLNDHLKVYYNFDNGKATNLVDANKYEGVINGNHLSIEDSLMGKALHFTKGDDSYLKIDNLVNTSTTSFSISMWYRYDSEVDRGNKKVVLFQQDNSGRTLTSLTSTNHYSSYINGQDIDSNNEVDIDKWQHIIFTYDKDSKQLNYYLNGVSDGLKASGNNVVDATTALLLGRHKNTGSDPLQFVGDMDEVRFYDKVVSDQEAKAIYEDKAAFLLKEDLQTLVDEAISLKASQLVEDNHVSAINLQNAIDEAKTLLKQNDLKLSDIENISTKLKQMMNAYRNAKGIVLNYQSDKVVRELSASLFGVNHRYGFNGYGSFDEVNKQMNEEFVKLYQEAAFGSLRYPGGTISNLFEWKHAIGDNRVKQIHGFYNNPNQHGIEPNFGLDEVASFADDMNSELVYVYGMGRGSAKDASDLIEYLNAKVGTNPNGGIDWALVRANNGHEEPYNVTYFEIGNEMQQAYAGSDGTASQGYWLTSVVGKGSEDAYIEGGIASFDKQYAVVEDDWNVSASYSTGLANQVFYMRYANPDNEDDVNFKAVIEGSVEVYVGNEKWNIVDDLNKASANDKVVEIDYREGGIKFGDGIHGMIPSSGQQIKVSYQVQREGFVGISEAMRETMNKINEIEGSKQEIKIYSSYETSGFINKMHNAKNDALYDGLTIHPYSGTPQGGSGSEASSLTFYYDALKKGDSKANDVLNYVNLMQQYDASKVPVISEYGIFRSTDPLVRSQTHALYIVKQIMDYIELGSPYIQKHCLVDWYSSGADSLGPTQQALIQAVPQANASTLDGSGEFKYFSTPSARVFEMFNHNFGKVMIDSKISNNPKATTDLDAIDAMVSLDDDYLYFAMTNYDVENTLRINLAGDLEISGKTYEMFVLDGDSISAENTLEDPTNVDIKRSVHVLDDSQSIELAPHSFVIVRVSLNEKEDDILNRALYEAKNYDVRGYLSDGVNALNEMIKAYETLSDNLSQSEINKYANDLYQAIENLQKVGDASELKGLLAKVKTLKESQYEASSWEKLQNVIKEVETYLASSDQYLQDDLKANLSKLQDAYNHLSYRELTNLINQKANDVKVVSFSSQCGGNTGIDENGTGEASATVDYNNNTYWHSNWMSNNGEKHTITYDLGKEYTLTDVTFLPRQDKRNGDIHKFEVYVGNDVDYTKNTLTGEYVFVEDGTLDSSVWYRAFVSDNGSFNGRYVTIRITGSYGDSGNDLFASMAEIRFYGSEVSEKPVVVDKTNLEKAIKDAKDVDTTNKTEDSIAVLTSALIAAEKVLADDKATQDEVDAAIKAINEAVANLKDIEVKPEYKGYDDVDSEAWYAGMVQEATIKGLMGKDGSVGNNFNPDGKITRGMVATVIYRMAGKPQVTYTDKFVDVKGGFWYSEAIVWASEAKVVSGYANGKFGPDDSIKREDFAIMLRNYANTCGLDTKSSQSLETFKDYKAVSAYAKDAIAWCVENGLMSGSKVGEEKYLNPSANTTRAEAAKMFVQLSNLIKK